MLAKPRSRTVESLRVHLISPTGLQQKIMDRYAPKNIQVQHDIVYATQPNLSFDLYQDSQLQDLAALARQSVWIHGGGWIAGSKAHARGYFKLLAAQGF